MTDEYKPYKPNKRIPLLRNTLYTMQTYKNFIKHFNQKQPNQEYARHARNYYNKKYKILANCIKNCYTKKEIRKIITYYNYLTINPVEIKHEVNLHEKNTITGVLNTK